MEKWSSWFFWSQMNVPVDRLQSQALLSLTTGHDWANTAIIQRDLQGAVVSEQLSQQMQDLVH